MSSPIDASLRLARRSLRITNWSLIPLYFLMVVALYGAFLYAPTEREMGEVQRIFYFHVGAAWNCFLAFFGVFLGGVGYLITRKRIWDHLAASCVEVGVVFTTIVLTTGPIWARPIWNTWWPWGDPRVMTTMVLWLRKGKPSINIAPSLGLSAFLMFPLSGFPSDGGEPFILLSSPAAVPSWSSK
jgi:ABC-type transport system involved in cytochrome c biogenesis permease subunit